MDSPSRDPRRLTCRAPHKLRHLPRFQGRTCGATGALQLLPHVPTGRILPGKDAKLDPDCAYAWCRDCKVWTEYRVQWEEVGCTLDRAA